MRKLSVLITLALVIGLFFNTLCNGENQAEVSFQRAVKETEMSLNQLEFISGVVEENIDRLEKESGKSMIAQISEFRKKLTGALEEIIQIRNDLMSVKTTGRDINKLNQPRHTVTHLTVQGE